MQRGVMPGNRRRSERFRMSAQRGALAFALLLMMSACAKTEYVGNGNKGFWSDSPAKVSPNEAFLRAQPHLEATWKARCQEERNHDDYCDKMPTDHMVRRGGYYYLTRTNYPYKSHEAYLKYAVRVDVNSGEVIPYQ